MKNTLSLIFGILLTGTLFAQGSIQGFTIVPASPTTSDDVKVYVDVMFTTGGCPVYTQGHFTASTVTDAFALHCLGSLAFICNSTDSFDLGNLEAGNHVFHFTLSSGSGGPPCTPGIIADDSDSTFFSVSFPTGINGYETGVHNLVINPNPFNTMARIKIDSELSFNKATLKIMDRFGKTVKTIDPIQTNEFTLERDDLINGIYFYQLTEKGKSLATGKFIIE